MQGTRTLGMQALARERDELAALLDATGVGTWIWNVQTGETRFNARWAEIVGYRLDELAPVSIATWQQLAHPDDLVRSDRELERHFRGETPRYACESRMRHKQGHWVHVLDCGQVVERDAAGKPLWMFGSHVDISALRLAERQRDAWLERLRRLAANVPGFLYQYRVRADGSAHFPFATDGITEVYGCTPAEVIEDAAPVFALLHPFDRPRVTASISRSASSLRPWHERYRVLHPTRGMIWVEGRSTPERDDDGSVTWHGYLHDVSDDQAQRERLSLAAKVFSVSQEGIMLVSPDIRILDVNPAFERITGYTRDEVLGQRPSMLSSGRHDADFYRRLYAQLGEEGRWQGEIWNRRADGELFAELLSIDAVRDEDGAVQNYVAVFTDIGRIKQRQNELDRIAHHDALTGLPNRLLLGARLEVALAEARRRGELVAVCFADLDGFKGINDRLGHAAGDQLLLAVAQAMKEAVREHDTVARIGGDEFVLVLTGLGERAALFDLVDRVLQAASREFILDAGPARVSASIGIALFPETNADAETLLRCADQAMYRAKHAGRNRYALYAASDPPVSERRHDAR